jgi:hypothetical protein
LRDGDTDDFAPIELLPFRIVEQPAGDRKRSLPRPSFAGHQRPRMLVDNVAVKSRPTAVTTILPSDRRRRLVADASDAARGNWGMAIHQNGGRSSSTATE